MVRDLHDQDPVPPVRDGMAAAEASNRATYGGKTHRTSKIH